MKTPETYIADRVKRVLDVLDAEDREALQIHITSEAGAKAETSQKLSIAWRSLWGFSLVLGVLGPLVWYWANQPISPVCPACPAPIVCSTPVSLEWNQLFSYREGLPLNRAVSDKQECISFSNGTVTCIPRFKTPDRVETPGPETPE